MNVDRRVMMSAGLAVVLILLAGTISVWLSRHTGSSVDPDTGISITYSATPRRDTIIKAVAWLGALAIWLLVSLRLLADDDRRG